jgi:hypothetical protein
VTTITCEIVAAPLRIRFVVAGLVSTISPEGSAASEA